MKKFLTSILIILISCLSLLYSSSFYFPVFASDQIEWEDLSNEDELIDAFRAYCKSRKLFIDGSVPDAVTKFTTQTFNDICNTLGIDVTALQAELKRRYSNGVYKYLFTVTGLNGFNRIFAEFLQNNDLAVGDEVDNKTLRSGRWFSDDNGNGCWVYISNLSNNSNSNYSNITSFGTPFIYTGQEIFNLVNTNGSFTINSVVDSVTYSIDCYNQISSPNIYTYVKGSKSYAPFVFRQNTNNESIIYEGCLCVVYYSANSKLFFAGQRNWYNDLDNNFLITPISEITNGSAPEADIYITTNNTTINNETVINEGDTYIIDQDGEPESDDPDPDPDPDPDDDWDPSPWPTIPPNSGPPSNGNTIEWPDIDLPNFDLGNWDFSLGDLRSKFPFSIPFDIVQILSFLDMAPQAPVIREDIPIRIDLMNVEYTLPIDLDMNTSTYNDFAVLVRAVEFIGFCLGLIHFTIRLVKG